MNVYVKHLGWTVTVVDIDFENRQIEVDLSGMGDTSIYSFDEVDFYPNNDMENQN